LWSSTFLPYCVSFDCIYFAFRRLKDVFNRPICSSPGGFISLIGRTSDDHYWTWKLDEKDIKKDCVNLASYNYLGFAENEGKCTEKTIEEVHKNGLTYSSCRQELGESILSTFLFKKITVGTLTNTA